MAFCRVLQAIDTLASDGQFPDGQNLMLTRDNLAVAAKAIDQQNPMPMHLTSVFTGTNGEIQNGDVSIYISLFYFKIANDSLIIDA